MQRICDILEAEGHRTVRGNSHWNIGTIRSILGNEKYKGDLLIQKTYTADFLTKEVKPNEGEVPQYYVEGHHEAIIDPDTWMQVQYELATRYNDRRSKTSVFSSRLVCADCGSWYGRKVWHSGSKYQSEVWRCNNKFAGEHKCTSATLRPTQIEDLFMQQAVRDLASRLRELDEVLPQAVAEALDTTDQRQEHEAVQEELARVVEQMEELVALNARTAKHRAGFLTTYEELDARRVELEEREAVLAESITGTDHRRSIVLATFQELRKSGTPIEFSPRLWVSLIEDAVVSDAEITFRFKAGQEISIPI